MRISKITCALRNVKSQMPALPSRTLVVFACVSVLLVAWRQPAVGLCIPTLVPAQRSGNQPAQRRRSSNIAVAH